MLPDVKSQIAVRPIQGQVRRLNVGCGRTFHPDWVNIDLDSVDPNVMACDVRQGLPFPDETFDVVYHSHVLEHLSPEDGERLLRECYRVLKPGGVLRVVVPDLEQIAKLYLEMHDLACRGDRQAAVDYNWIKLELLDQLVRDFSGGRMGRYMSDPQIQNSDFVRSRVGDEFWICRRQDHGERHERQRSSLAQRLGNAWQRFRERATMALVRWLMGRQAERAFEEGLFRNQGEIHRWMYDRFSLQELTASVGFAEFEVCSADTSHIEDFGRFELDVSGTAVRKPDSLFVECFKPVEGERQRRSA